MKRLKAGRTGLVLNAIPRDRFVGSGEIASKSGVSPQGVGVLIRWNLLPYVEVKEVDDPKPGTKVYRRRPGAGEAEA